MPAPCLPAPAAGCRWRIMRPEFGPFRLITPKDQRFLYLVWRAAACSQGHARGAGGPEIFADSGRPGALAPVRPALGSGPSGRWHPRSAAPVQCPGSAATAAGGGDSGECPDGILSIGGRACGCRGPCCLQEAFTENAGFPRISGEFAKNYTNDECKGNYFSVPRGGMRWFCSTPSLGG